MMRALPTGMKMKQSFGGLCRCAWLGVLGLMMGLVALPTARADILSRELGTNGAGEVVTGYVYQAGRSRGRSRNLSRQSRLGPRVSGTRRFGPGIDRGYVVAPVVTYGGIYTPYFGRRFYSTTGCGFGYLGTRVISVGGRLSFKLGY